MRPASWLPPVVWMGFIMWFSSASFSAEQTGGALHPFLMWLLPWLTPPQAEAIHLFLRKGAHFTEYAILAALWFRAFVQGRSLTPRRGAWLALTISLAWAFLDEAHQATIPARQGSAGDVIIDAAGALAVLIVRRRGGRATLDVVADLLLGVAATGGALVLGVNAFAGVASGALWVTVPVAALLLLIRRLGRRA